LSLLSLTVISGAKLNGPADDDDDDELGPKTSLGLDSFEELLLLLLDAEVASLKADVVTIVEDAAGM
jgi:hypothetical protein